MAAPNRQARPRIPALAAIVVSAAGAFMAVALLVLVGLTIYYTLAEHYYNREHGWLSPDGILRNFKIAFYGIVGAWVLAVPGAAWAAARWLRAPQPATVSLSVVLMLLTVWPALRLLSFSNACNLGDSFPFPGLSC